MRTYLSILRGINVSGQRIIKMDALRDLFSDLGFKDCQTYIQSGNVIFRNEELETAELESMIAEKIASKFNFNVPVIVKSLEEIQQIIARNPFVKDASKELAHLHVTFLSAQPDKSRLEKVGEIKFAPDEFRLIDKAIYLYCPISYGNTKFSNSFFETKLKVIATTRNWKTATELLNMAENLSSH